MRLEDLGIRICILGPSNSGKSTLAAAIARSRALEPVHLDLLSHLPNTDWEPRPIEDFTSLHDQAVAGEQWVMDGNYSHLLPPRLARATGLILLDVATPTSLMRYVRRTLFERERAGSLDGGLDSLKWEMIHHIVVTTRVNRRRYARMYAEIDLPKVWLSSTRQIDWFYRSEGLRRCGASALGSLAARAEYDRRSLYSDRDPRRRTRLFPLQRCSPRVFSFMSDGYS